MSEQNLIDQSKDVAPFTKAVDMTNIKNLGADALVQRDKNGEEWHLTGRNEAGQGLYVKAPENPPLLALSAFSRDNYNKLSQLAAAMDVSRPEFLKSAVNSFVRSKVYDLMENMEQRFPEGTSSGQMLATLLKPQDRSAEAAAGPAAAIPAPETPAATTAPAAAGTAAAATAAAPEKTSVARALAYREMGGGGASRAATEQTETAAPAAAPAVAAGTPTPASPIIGLSTTSGIPQVGSNASGPDYYANANSFRLPTLQSVAAAAQPAPATPAVAAATPAGAPAVERPIVTQPFPTVSTTSGITEERGSDASGPDYYATANSFRSPTLQSVAPATPAAGPAPASASPAPSALAAAAQPAPATPAPAPSAPAVAGTPATAVVSNGVNPSPAAPTFVARQTPDRAMAPAPALAPADRYGNFDTPDPLLVSGNAYSRSRESGQEDRGRSGSGGGSNTRNLNYRFAAAENSGDPNLTADVMRALELERRRGGVRGVSSVTDDSAELGYASAPPQISGARERGAPTLTA